MPETPTTEPTADDRLSMRSTGVQARSRERVEQLLAAAEILIAEGGIDGLKMRELARRAGLPIASVYHYFPSSSAVLRAIATRHLAEFQEFLKDRLPSMVKDGMDDEARVATAGDLVRDVASFLLKSPTAAAIWDSLRANPELRALDMEDTAKNAGLLAPYIGWVVPQHPADNLHDTTVMIIESFTVNLVSILNSATEKQADQIGTLVNLIMAMLRGMQSRPTHK